jgi:hypothetical protein
MLKLFPHPRPDRQAAAQPPRAALRLESLEPRYCPAAPQITLAVQPLNSGRMVQLSGTVVDGNPASVAVIFRGVVSATTTASAAGNFRATAQASGLGTVSAVGVDDAGLSSNTAQAAVASSVPTLTLSLAYGAQRAVTLSGQVTAPAPGGLTVTFTGAAAGTTTTHADGSYSLTVTASQLGNVQAVVQDPWGQNSAPAQVTVANNAPTVTNFQAIHQSLNVWTFQGQVTDESAPGLSVRFGGLPSLAGQMVTVGSDGWFYLTITLQAGEAGTASAQTTDWWGLNSNTALADVSPL